MVGHGLALEIQMSLKTFTLTILKTIRLILMPEIMLLPILVRTVHPYVSDDVNVKLDSWEVRPANALLPKQNVVIYHRFVTVNPIWFWKTSVIHVLTRPALTWLQKTLAMVLKFVRTDVFVKMDMPRMPVETAFQRRNVLFAAETKFQKWSLVHVMVTKDVTERDVLLQLFSIQMKKHT